MLEIRNFARTCNFPKCVIKTTSFCPGSITVFREKKIRITPVAGSNFTFSGPKSGPFFCEIIEYAINASSISSGLRASNEPSLVELVSVCPAARYRPAGTSPAKLITYDCAGAAKSFCACRIGSALSHRTVTGTVARRPIRLRPGPPSQGFLLGPRSPVSGGPAGAGSIASAGSSITATVCNDHGELFNSAAVSSGVQDSTGFSHGCGCAAP